jgi:hypothetical protein
MLRFFPKGEFEIKLNQFVYWQRKTKVDNDCKENRNRHFDKSYFKTWFNDIFMGKFDLRYIEEMNEEFNPEIKPKKKLN